MVQAERLLSACFCLERVMNLALEPSHNVISRFGCSLSLALSFKGCAEVHNRF